VGEEENIGKGNARGFGTEYWIVGDSIVEEGGS